MKKILKKACSKYLALVLVLLLVSAVCLLFSSRKSGMFIDEIYTYALSNSDHAPFLIDLKNGEMVGTVFTREELETMVEKVLLWFKDNAYQKERLGAAIDRVGVEALKLLIAADREKKAR